MENPTFRSRIATLMQKSRKALRLYTSVGRVNSEGSNEFTEMQAREWKGVNAELLRQLSLAMEHANLKMVIRDVFAIRDRFHSEWRSAEANLHTRQRDLVFAAENGDYIRSALLSTELVSLKARLQASQAAHHEINDVIRLSRLSQPPIELSVEQVLPEEEEDDEFQSYPLAKVIPIRKR